MSGCAVGAGPNKRSTASDIYAGNRTTDVWGWGGGDTVTNGLTARNPFTTASFASPAASSRLSTIKRPS